MSYALRRDEQSRHSVYVSFLLLATLQVVLLLRARRSLPGSDPKRPAPPRIVVYCHTCDGLLPVPTCESSFSCMASLDQGVPLMHVHPIVRPPPSSYLVAPGTERSGEKFVVPETGMSQVTTNKAIK